MAIGPVYLVMVILFRSLLVRVVILYTLPLAIIGAFVRRHARRPVNVLLLIAEPGAARGCKGVDVVITGVPAALFLN